MAIKIWDGSSWQMASQIKFWDGSAWQNGANGNVHIWTGTTWQKVHPGAELEPLYSVSALDFSGPPNAEAQAELVLFANGKIQTFESTSFGGTTRTYSADWLLTATNGEYDVYVTDFVGDTLSFSDATDGTRGALSSSRVYRLNSTYGETKSATFNLNICSNTGGGTVIQSAAVVLYAEASI